jgi:AraC family transcriptional activator of tynA and feaB
LVDDTHFENAGIRCKDRTDDYAREEKNRSEDVARAMRISVRSLNRLFERSGTSLPRRLLELRLDAVRDAILADGRARIADTALACGFSDISSFNRGFRGRFGRPPSDLRD